MGVNIAELQAYLAEHYKDRATEQGLFMKLVEEVGEVAEVLNKRAGRKASSENDLAVDLAEELADIIHYVVGIAAINDLDLEQTILDKDKRAAIKYNHERNLSDFLAEKGETDE
ncbi:MazG nucleotide pyrophosphohydrolase domain-containing protein [Streptococcus caprae]|uniref:MazG nucleotide pyrophosphohydrolase domain-containing protein n=1 Tax=Streptococcus caprae TaxID=1640501 RepID=A0ABV8CV12_9STRE